MGWEESGDGLTLFRAEPCGTATFGAASSTVVLLQPTEMAMATELLPLTGFDEVPQRMTSDEWLYISVAT